MSKGREKNIKIAKWLGYVWWYNPVLDLAVLHPPFDGAEEEEASEFIIKLTGEPGTEHQAVPEFWQSGCEMSLAEDAIAKDKNVAEEYAMHLLSIVSDGMFSRDELTSQLEAMSVLDLFKMATAAPDQRAEAMCRTIDSLEKGD